MKASLIIIISFVLSFNLLFGQNNKYNCQDNTSIELLNELCCILRGTDSTFLISPYIVAPIDTTLVNIPQLIQKYGFRKEEFRKSNTDSCILENNLFIEVLNPDSLTKYRRFHDDKLWLENPVLYFIKKDYGKSGICYFHKIIYSRNKSLALIEYMIYCGSECGHGEIILLKKHNKSWKKLKTLVESES